MKYHSAVYMPKIRARSILLEYSNHALESARDDYYANLTRDLPRSVDTSQVLIVEAETQVNQAGKEELTKLVVRGNLDERLDLCLAIVPKCGDTWTVKTVWANESRDNHRSLRNRHEYATGPRAA
jgi:hypothetical protein